MKPVFVRTMTSLITVVLLSAGMAVNAEEASSAAAVERKQAVRGYQVVENETSLGISFPAKVRSRHSVELVCLVSGTLIELNVREGQLVEKGELLARVDPTDYENNLLAAKARHTEAKLNYERLKKLRKSEVVTQAKLDQAKSGLDVSRASLQIAQKALDDTYIYAPFDGQIAKRQVEKFAFVGARKPLFTLLDTSKVEFVVQVPEGMMLKGIDAISKNARVYLDALPERQFKLELSEFQTKADSYTQTYGVVFVMPQPKGLTILPGMTATVLLQPDDNSSAATVKVPVSAVFSDHTKRNYVWIIGDDKRVRKQEVAVFAITGDRLLLESGIDPGGYIVESGVHYLREGDSVNVLN